MNMGPNSPFWAIFFWVYAVACVALGIWLVRRFEKEKKRLKDGFKDHYLKQLKWVFRRELEEHGAEDEKTNPRN